MPKSRVRPLRRTFRTAAALAAAAALALPLPAQAPAAGNLSGGARSATAPASALAARIDSVLARPALRQARWGIEVRDAATGRVLYARDADRPFVPASNLKLVVAAAAAHHLDPDYRFRTTVYAEVPLAADGTLAGDLVLYGRGDPMISGRYFPARTRVLEALADSLAARGVRRVAGVTADESWLDAERVVADWDPDDLTWWYAAPVSALGFNDNAIDFRVESGARVGAPARITWQPETEYVRLVNETRTVARGGAYTLDFVREAGTGRVRAFGTLPLGAAVRLENVAVDDPARWTATVFREVLERRGIAVDRREVRVVTAPERSRAAELEALAEHRSPALAQAIGPVLLNSQNWFAELLAKTMAREVAGEGSWPAALALERSFLVDEVGLDPASFVLRDASGLSDRNRITPHALAELLAYVRRTPRMAVVRRSLPVAGRTGSLTARLPDLAGRVAAKTGYIGGADSLSGFLTDAAGREVIFVVIANDGGQPSARMKAGIDDVVRAVASGAR